MIMAKLHARTVFLIAITAKQVFAMSMDEVVPIATFGCAHGNLWSAVRIVVTIPVRIVVVIVTVAKWSSVKCAFRSALSVQKLSA